MKVLIAGIHLESNTFSSHRTEYRDFTVYEDLSHLSAGVVTFASSIGIELIPGIFARAVPGGMLRHDVYNAFQGRIFEGVREKSFDAVLLRLHGATVLEDFSSGEERLIRALRHYIGPMRPIAATFDLHGNMRQEAFDCLQYATALRTAPHTDFEQTVIRALSALNHIVQKSLPTSIVCKRLPLILPGEAFMTTREPAQSLYEQLASDSIATTGVCSSIFCGFAWADVPHAGVTVVSCGTPDVIDLDSHNTALAESIWKVRRDCVPADSLYSLPAAFEIISESHEPVFLSDTGDNITAGANGNDTKVLEYALQHEYREGLFAQFWDKDLVQLAGSLGSGASIPLQRLQIHNYMATVISIHSAFSLQHAVLECEGNTLIISEERFPFVSNEHFNALNIEVSAYQYAVFKLGYLYPDLAATGFRSLLLNTKGAAALDLSLLKYKNLQRPVYPLDENAKLLQTK